jgi:hypothetical protein
MILMNRTAGRQSTHPAGTCQETPPHVSGLTVVSWRIAVRRTAEPAPEAEIFLCGI